MDIFDWLEISVPAAAALGFVFGIIRQKDGKLHGRAAFSTRVGFSITTSSLVIFIIVLKANHNISPDVIQNLVLWLVTPCVSTGMFLIIYGKTIELINVETPGIESLQADPQRDGQEHKESEDAGN